MDYQGYNWKKKTNNFVEFIVFFVLLV